MTHQTRRCHCGIRLADDAVSDKCTACARLALTEPTAPVVPDAFWDTPEMLAALATQHMGKVIAAYRRHPYHGVRIPQTVMARWTLYTQANLSLIEKGPAIDSMSKLRTWSTLLGIPKTHQWFTGIRLQEATASSKLQISAREINLAIDTSDNLEAMEWFQGSRIKVESGSEVGVDDVEIVNEMVKTFKKIDNRFGGGRARSMVNDFLGNEVMPILHAGTFRGNVRDGFYAAAADLSHLAGWMAYDVGDSSSGRRYLSQALRFSKEMGDYARTSEMFAAMSHQASFARSHDLAIDFADSARDNAKKSGIVVLEVEAFVMAAHGFALKGESDNSRNAMRNAEKSFRLADLESAPEWLRYFDEAYMSAKFAHCFRELGNFKEAEAFARRSLEMSDGFHRGRLFNTALLASILTDQGLIDEACALSLDALKMAGQMQSNRTNQYLEEVFRKLRIYNGASNVSDVIEQYESASLKRG